MEPPVAEDTVAAELTVDPVQRPLDLSAELSARDSAAGLILDTLPAPPLPTPVGEAAAIAPAPGDTMPLHATLAEMDALGRTMAVPVQGVAARDLRDTYTETRGGRVHEAIDIHAPRGTPVTAATDGRVLKLFDSRAGGLMVYAADAGDRFIFMYGHLDSYAPGLVEGMVLRRGTLLGYVGTTGNSPPNAPHLHLAIARGRPAVAGWKGTPVNPYPMFVRPGG